MISVGGERLGAFSVRSLFGEVAIHCMVRDPGPYGLIILSARESYNENLKKKDFEKIMLRRCTRLRTWAQYKNIKKMCFKVPCYMYKCNTKRPH